jgi:hypothetical protein
VAVDLAGGKIVWRQPLGTMEEPFPEIAKSAAGSVVLGGPIVTAGGLIFAGGSMDRRFRAFSADTGKELWSAMLPASAHALPITFEVGGRQFVVIAAGGSAFIDEERQSDALIAFALPPQWIAPARTASGSPWVPRRFRGRPGALWCSIAVSRGTRAQARSVVRRFRARLAISPSLKGRTDSAATNQAVIGVDRPAVETGATGGRASHQHARNDRSQHLSISYCD